jgi:hypothetical protein
MEALSAPPPPGDGLISVISESQLEHAIRKGIAGFSMQQLPLIRTAAAGQPIFLFTSDSHMLHGPYTAVGAGGMNLDASSTRTLHTAAQVRFAPVVRKFMPLPEESVNDLLSFETGHDGKRRPCSVVEGAVVKQLLLLFVLRHHGLYASDDTPDSSPAPIRGGAPSTPPMPMPSGSDDRAVALLMAAFLKKREGQQILATSLGEFYGTLGSQAEGDDARTLVRICQAAGCKRGLQSFVTKHRDLLRLVGERLNMGVAVA